MDGETPEEGRRRAEDRPKLADLVDMNDPEAILAETIAVARLIQPALDGGFVRHVFGDVRALFDGVYPHYRRCNTDFHDFSHTTDCLLAMVRLMHGAWLSGLELSEKEVHLGLVTALMHDTGYIQKESETEGTGGSYTMIHVDRSIEFMERYFDLHGLSEDDFHLCRRCIKCTGLDVHISAIRFVCKSQEFLGKMLGTADLLGQIAARTYLEKLLFLYREFAEAGIPGFADEEDLLRKTANFYEITKKRLKNELSGMNLHVRAHFAARHGVDADLYIEAMDNNIAYLGHVLAAYGKDYRPHLRRGGIVHKAAGR